MRYLAQRMGRDGPAEILDVDLPLAGVSITEALSGPGAMTCNIPVEFERLRDDRGRPLLQEWGTAVYPEVDGEIRDGFLLAHGSFTGPAWSMECVGFTGYLKGLPYTGSDFAVEVDPLDRVRHIVDHAQTQHSPLGLLVDQTRSPVRIGTELEQAEFDTQAGPVAFEAGPHRLAWWMTHDLLGEIDALAGSTPFDYGEEHAWNAARTDIEHRMRLWYPGRSRRQTTMRFVLGENVSVEPTVEHAGDEFANAVYVLGAGEGRDMVRSPVITSESDDRLRRVAVVTDKSLRSIASATTRARGELAARLLLERVSTVEVRQHPHADLNEIEPGDEILLQAETGWVDVDDWFRVLERTYSPDTPEQLSLTVERVA